jgi:hypothetical protein
MDGVHNSHDIVPSSIYFYMLLLGWLLLTILSLFLKMRRESEQDLFSMCGRSTPGQTIRTINRTASFSCCCTLEFIHSDCRRNPQQTQNVGVDVFVSFLLLLVSCGCTRRGWPP